MQAGGQRRSLRRPSRARLAARRRQRPAARRRQTPPSRQTPAARRPCFSHPQRRRRKPHSCLRPSPPTFVSAPVATDIRVCARRHRHSCLRPSPPTFVSAPVATAQNRGGTDAQRAQGGLRRRCLHACPQLGEPVGSDAEPERERVRGNMLPALPKRLKQPEPCRLHSAAAYRPSAL